MKEPRESEYGYDQSVRETLEAVCAQRDAAIAQRDKLLEAVAELRWDAIQDQGYSGIVRKLTDILKEHEQCQGQS